MLWWSSELVDCLSFVVFVCLYTPLQFLNFMNADVFVTVFHHMCWRDITALRVPASSTKQTDSQGLPVTEQLSRAVALFITRCLTCRPVADNVYLSPFACTEKSPYFNPVLCNIFILRYTCSSFGRVSTNV